MSDGPAELTGARCREGKLLSDGYYQFVTRMEGEVEVRWSDKREETTFVSVSQSGIHPLNLLKCCFVCNDELICGRGPLRKVSSFVHVLKSIIPRQRFGV